MNVNGFNKPLFPLEKINTRIGGYYMDSDFNVYSTKQSPIPQRLSGSSTMSGRYYTLNRVSFSEANLRHQVKNHKDFLKETAPWVEMAVPIGHDLRVLKGSPANRRHAKTVAEGLAGRGWVIAQVSVHKNEQFLLFGSKPAIHLTAESVHSEMERLAGSKPGVKFVSLKVDKTVVSGGLSWS